MLWTLVGIIIILWLLGFGFEVGGNLIHILLIVALIVALFNLIGGRRRI